MKKIVKKIRTIALAIFLVPVLSVASETYDFKKENEKKIN